MGGGTLSLPEIGHYGVERVVEIWESLGKNNLWRRMLKNVLATTLAVSISLIPASSRAIGRASYLAAMTTVFAHPGRRFGQMAEGLILTLSGSVLGLAWSVLGVYLGSLVFRQNSSAAYAIRGIFLAVALLFHGFLRSHTPRLWIFVLLQIIVCITALTTTSVQVTSTYVTQIVYPILVAAGIILMVNICVFPEFSSSFLGQTTIETLNDTAKALADAGHYFVETSKAAENVGIDGDQVDARSECADVDEDFSEPRTPSGLRARRGLSGRIIVPTVPHKLEGEETQHPKNAKAPSLEDLTSIKAKLRTKLASCKTAQNECLFELAFSVLPPRYLKFISVRIMKRLVANTIAIIGACESRYALLGEVGTNSSERSANAIVSDGDTAPHTGAALASDSSGDPPAAGNRLNTSTNSKSEHGGHGGANLELIKPKREIEFGDAYLLRYLLNRISIPYAALQSCMMRSVDVVSACLAYAYDVPRLPSGARAPKGISVEELDLYIGALQEALVTFDAGCSAALDSSAGQDVLEDQDLDILPREEMFLISSFLLNQRQAAVHIAEMLKHSRQLVERRHGRRDRRRLYAPHIRWRKWLYTGGEEEEATPERGRKAARQGVVDDQEDDDSDTEISDNTEFSPQGEETRDIEEARSTEGPVHDSQDTSNTSRTRPKSVGSEEQQERPSLSLRFRGRLADIIDWLQYSEDLQYALKLTIATVLVTWPSFVPAWNTWYSLNRGAWAALQLVFIAEVAIGPSIMTFVIRGLGTTLGSLWGWAAYEARDGNPIVCAAMIFIGLIPSVYVQLGTQYPKAGMVSIVNMCVVALSTELQTIPGSGTENFLKRWIAFMIGGVVALIVEVVFLPVKARTRMVESVAATLKQISEMEGCIAFGIEQGNHLNGFPPEVSLRFERASSKAKTALSAAETFLPFCSTEPRLKGSFAALVLIYSEIIFVLRQIVDRMDNMLQLRTAYGSGPLEEFNVQIHPYRRNVAGSVTLVLFAVHEALTTKLPLPQFLPSTRLAHLRMINKVREVIHESVREHNCQEGVNKLAQQRVDRHKFMSWNASSAAQAEVIEYLEELTDLTKLLVGANEFRSGLLTRPTYREYAEKVEKTNHEVRVLDGAEAGGNVEDTPKSFGLTRRRTTTMRRQEEKNEIPASLQRIQSRNMEASMRRQRTREN